MSYYQTDEEVSKLQKNSDGLDLGKTTQDIFDAGYNNLMQKSTYTASTSNVVVNTGASTQDVANYLSAIAVDEYIQLTVDSSSASGIGGYEGSTSYTFKDAKKDKAPAAIAFLKTGVGEDATYTPLPHYEIEASTAYITEIHRFSTRRKTITLETYSGSPGEFVYDIYIIKDKIEREYT